MLTAELDVFRCAPHNELLTDRAENEAFCLADPGRAYAVCFLNGGEVALDCSGIEGQATLRWLAVADGSWHEPQAVDPGSALRLAAPDAGFWAVLVSAEW